MPAGNAMSFRECGQFFPSIRLQCFRGHRALRQGVAVNPSPTVKSAPSRHPRRPGPPIQLDPAETKKGNPAETGVALVDSLRLACVAAELFADPARLGLNRFGQSLGSCKGDGLQETGMHETFRPRDKIMSRAAGVPARRASHPTNPRFVGGQASSIRHRNNS